MLETELLDRVFRITLNRPEKRNALSFELCQKLLDALERAESDPEIRAIVLTAQGNYFCAGMDLGEVGALAEGELSAAHQSLFSIRERMTKPIIAAVSGDALGGGVGLVANAHIAVACPRVGFGLSEIRIGLWPFLIFRSVAAAVGQRTATEWSLTGRMVDTEGAKAAGLIQYISKNALDTAMEMAGCLARSSRTAVKLGMEYVNQSAEMPSDKAGELARKLRGQVMQSSEFAEGLKAFREKRPTKEC